MLFRSNASTSASVSVTSDLSTKLTKSTKTITDVSNNLTAINSNGITLFATGNANAEPSEVPTTGARMVMNYKGLTGYDSTSTNSITGITFSINASTGSAYFNGEIVSSLGTIGGWSIGSDKLYSDTIELYATGGIGSLGGIKFTGATDYSIYNNFGLFTIEN